MLWKSRYQSALSGLLCLFFVSHALAVDKIQLAKHKICVQKKAACVKKVKKPKSVWKGSHLRFGLNIQTGNSNSSQYDGAFKVNFAKKRWVNKLHLSETYGKAEDVLNKRRFSVGDELRYGFDNTRRHFLFASANWVNDLFSPYDYQTVYAVGYGFDIVNVHRLLWTVQVGPGYRYDELRDSDVTQTHYVTTVRTHIALRIREAGTLSETLHYDFGEPFDYYNSKVAFTSRVTKCWSFQISYRVEHYSRIPKMSSNVKKTDTTTNAAIIYNF